MTGDKWGVTSGNKKALKIGREVFRHPKGYFIVLEFRAKGGRYRESFYPEMLVSIGRR